MDIWLNTIDFWHRSRYKVLYNIKSTPQVYVLDKDKKIVAKRIEDKQLDQYLGRAFGLEEGTNEVMENDLEE